MKESEIARRRLLVPRGDAPPSLDGVEEALDDVALLVEFFVMATFGVSARIRRDDRANSAFFEFVEDPVSVVGLVGEYGRGMHVVDELFSDCGVMLLSGRDENLQRSALQVDCHVDLCGESAS